MNYSTNLTTTTSIESTIWALTRSATNDSQHSFSSEGPAEQPPNKVCDPSRIHFKKRINYTHLLPVTLLAVFLLAVPVQSWGASSSSSSEKDTTLFGNSFTRDWLYDSSSISLKVEGCVLGVVEDQDDFGCLEDESEDGTTNWYMMANCKRPQVAFSVYASSGSSTSCNSGNFKESFITKNGLSEFIYYLAKYDSNFNYDNNDDGYGYEDLPVCEQSNNGGYMGLDCNSDGSFSINYFNDQYCLSRTENQYDQLKDVNNMLSNYEQCNAAYSSGDDKDYSLVHQLVYYSETCRSMDSSLCTDNEYFQERSSGNGGGGGGSSSSRRGWSSSSYMGAKKSWVTKLKYVVGGLFLLASFIMFTGILFTNRRRRRAMMMRKYRQSKKDKLRDRASGSTSKKSSRSASKSKRSRSKSKKESSGDGVFT